MTRVLFICRGNRGEKQMHKKYAKTTLVGGICAIIGGILIMIGAFMGEAFPKALWIVAAICEFANAFVLLKNCWKVDRSEERPE